MEIVLRRNEAGLPILWKCGLRMRCGELVESSVEEFGPSRYEHSQNNGTYNSYRKRSAMDRPSWVAPLMAGNITTEDWEAASKKVWELRMQYPPDSLSAIFRDIAIKLQAQADKLEQDKIDYQGRIALQDIGLDACADKIEALGRELEVKAFMQDPCEKFFDLPISERRYFYQPKDKHFYVPMPDPTIEIAILRSALVEACKALGSGAPEETAKVYEEAARRRHAI